MALYEASVDTIKEFVNLKNSRWYGKLGFKCAKGSFTFFNPLEGLGTFLKEVM